MDNEIVLMAGLVAIIAVSAWLSLIDFREHRLPNRIVGPLAIGAVVWVVVMGAIDRDLARSATAVGWGVAGFAVFFAFHLLANVGMGDVKYAFPVCVALGWFGWDSLRVGLLVMCISGAVVALVMRFQGKAGDYRMAFGPYMALGVTAGLLAGAL